MINPAISSFSGHTPFVVMVTLRSTPKEGRLLPEAKRVDKEQSSSGHQAVEQQQTREAK
jgi:hypothetical protein